MSDPKNESQYRDQQYADDVTEIFHAVTLAAEALARAIRRLPTGDATLTLPSPILASLAQEQESDDQEDPDAEEGDLDQEDEEDEEDEEDKCPPLPFALGQAARRAGGLRMEWMLDIGGRRVQGVFALPDEPWLLEHWTRTFMDGEPGFSIAPSSEDIEICWPANEEGPEVYFFDDNGLCFAESSVQDAFGWMIDRLGLPGWADLRDGETQSDDDDGDGEGEDDGQNAAAAELDALVSTVYETVGMPKTSIGQWRAQARATSASASYEDLAVRKQALILASDRTLMKASSTAEEVERTYRALHKTGDHSAIGAWRRTAAEKFLRPRKPRGPDSISAAEPDGITSAEFERKRQRIVALLEEEM